MRRRFGMQLIEDLWPAQLREGEGGGGAGGAGGDPPGGDPKGGDGDPKGGEGGRQPSAYELQLRKEAEAYRKRAEAAEKKLKEREDADLSETERLKKEAAAAGERAAAAEQKSRQRIAKAEVLSAAVGAKIVDPEAAFLLVRDRIEFDDEGEPKNVKELIAELVKSKPYLLGGGGEGGDGGAGGGNPGKGRPLTLDQISELASKNPAEFNRRYEAGEFKGVL